MQRQYFGTDGIRGRVGDSVINSEFMLKLGWAIGTALQNKPHHTILIGRDTRISGGVLQAALEAGLASAGASVYDLGVLPTPAVAFLVQSMRAQAGIVISASHNPYHDNGVKIFDKHGMKLSDALEVEIERLLEQPMKMVPSEEMSDRQSLIESAQGRYIEYCKTVFPNQLSLENTKIVIDAAHGAGFQVGPTILRELGADVLTMGCSPDGFNINKNSGALHTQALQHEVLKQKADIGIALDGDGDRLLLVDERGELIDGDEILCMLAQESATGMGSHAGVVGTLMSNLGLEQALNGLGIDFERTKVGDRYVLERLLEKGWTLGGEASGHIVNLDYATTGDGIITALQILRIMQMQKISLYRLKQGMVKRPQILKNIPYDGQCNLLEHPMLKDAINTVETKLAGRGRVLLRLSGTEPLLRVMVEGDDAQEVSQWVDYLTEAVKRYV